MFILIRAFADCGRSVLTAHVSALAGFAFPGNAFGLDSPQLFILQEKERWAFAKGLF